MDTTHARPGLTVIADLSEKVVGGVTCAPGTCVPAVVAAAPAGGQFITVELETPIGGGQRRALLPGRSRPQRLVALEPDRVALRDPAPGNARSPGQVAGET
jgi:hypothetical protein